MTVMQVNPANVTTVPLSQGASTLLRVLGGDLPAQDAGKVLAATVKQVAGGLALLDLGGAAVTVKAPPGLRPDATLLVRVPPSGGKVLDLVGEVQFAGKGDPAALASGPGKTLAVTVSQVADGQARLELPGEEPLTVPANDLQPGDKVLVRLAGANSPPPSANAAPGQAAAAGVPAGRTARVEVLAQAPDGSLRVSVDGKQVAARSAEPLQVGGKYVLQVQSTPAGVTLRPLPASAALPAEVASAVLRDSPPSGEVTTPLRALFAAVTRFASPADAGNAPATAESQAARAAALKETLSSLLPAADRPPTAAQLEGFVRNGGLLYESKLAEQAAGNNTPANSVANDLKGHVLRVVQDAAGGVSAAPMTSAARGMLEHIETGQAANVLAQVHGEAYHFQIPLPMTPDWQTLHLAVTPDRSGPATADGQARGFHVLMHVDLTDLGETWIDASLAGNRLRAVLYVESAAGRERIRPELGALQSELRGEGFADVLLDVRATADLPDRQRRQASAARGGVPGSVSLLDVRA